MVGRLQRLPGMRFEPAPNSEYAPISEMRLITCDYGMACKHYSGKPTNLPIPGAAL